MRALESPFKRVTCHSEFVGLFVSFLLIYCVLLFPSQGAKKNTCLRFAISNFCEKLQNIFEIGLKKYGVMVQKSLLKKGI